ncbi:MAG: hypothetical protein A2712_05165 [Deltaproteobacteria bacterium RIFCSPHIGHO2_01_FULL_43_49]|nr:MAG: hypothetical protein A2712_05165 [Deltaproteobacteria bacterium RIFCSPHIGHO2_01_FULL_43_49]OGQ14406.1 MAG: hypothetical protein A3D22_05220 [Deltaproteobacteria bacterium RIFCSPHIGHO2_02_FULL_44_53]OGQ42528.1 MAG: hypothetical protein A3I70_11155 [Deltaproteobacteria bacterium RIFCSPLOWO2_02_FULL_44_34]
MKQKLVPLSTLFLLSLLALLSASRCGNMNDLSVAGTSVSVELIVTNPDPNASGSAKAVSSSDVSVVKDTNQASLSSCTLTITAADMDTVTSTSTVNADASTVTFSNISVAAGSNRTFAVECVDSSETTNGINIGYRGSATTDLDGSGTNTVSISAKFLNLLADGTSGSDPDVSYVRCNQPTSTTTTCDMAFGTSMDDALKASIIGYIEFNGAQLAGSDGVVDANRTDAGSCGLKKDIYLRISGGVSKPTCELFDSNDTSLMRATGEWTTSSGGNILARCTFSITNMQDKVDSNQKGGWCSVVVDTTSGNTDAIPNSGFGEYDFSSHTNVVVANLASNSGSCSADVDCDSGFCGTGSTCIVSSAPTLAGSVTTYLGPAAGCYNTCSSGAGNINAGGDSTSASFNQPSDACFTKDGTKMYIADTTNRLIRSVNVSTLQMNTVAGQTGVSGSANGVGSDASFSSPQGCAVDPNDSTILYVTEVGNHRIRKIVVDTSNDDLGTVTTFAGNGTGTDLDGTGTAAQFDTPVGIVFDPEGENLYVADLGGATIRKVVVDTAVVTTFAGTADTTGTTNGVGSAARFNRPHFIAMDPTGTNIYVTDDTNNTVRQINLATQSVTTLSGDGTGTDATTDGTGTAASFSDPTGITIDPWGTYLYVAERAGNTIRKIKISTQVVETIAGSSTAGDANGTGTAAQFWGPRAIKMDPTGTKIYIIGQRNHKIRLLQ